MTERADARQDAGPRVATGPGPGPCGAATRFAAGFSLIEVLISAAILSVCLLGIIGSLLVSHEGVAYGGSTSRAVHLAQQRIEELKSGAAAAFPLNVSTGTQTVDQYTVTWTISNVGFGGAADDLQRISVSVTWPQRVRPGRYDLAGFVSRPY